MAVVFGSPDLLPSLSVVYACDCGLCIGAYGGHAGDPPPGWLHVSEGKYICEQCAASTRDAGKA